MPDLSPAPPAPPHSQDDRLLAACAHLSFFVGFWLVVPAAIYVAKRKTSRFVAFHALQAAFVQLLFTVIGTVVAVAFLLLAGTAGVLDHAVPALAFVLVAIVVAGGSSLTLLVVHALAAYSAWQGHTREIPIAGGLAYRILSADTGAAKG
jgi:uncharacterized membrane protein